MMGESVYQVQGRYGNEWVDVLIQWADGEDNLVEIDPLTQCLCTWPGSSEEIEERHLRALALLGAAVALAHHGDDSLVTSETYWPDGTRCVRLPQDVPQWVRDEIMRLVPEEVS